MVLRCVASCCRHWPRSNRDDRGYASSLIVVSLRHNSRVGARDVRQTPKWAEMPERGGAELLGVAEERAGQSARGQNCQRNCDGKQVALCHEIGNSQSDSIRQYRRRTSIRNTFSETGRCDVETSRAEDSKNYDACKGRWFRDVRSGSGKTKIKNKAGDDGGFNAEQNYGCTAECIGGGTARFHTRMLTRKLERWNSPTTGFEIP